VHPRKGYTRPPTAAYAPELPLRRHDDPEPATEAADRSWAVVLMEAVGPQRREAVFRALTRVLHPDVTGGDNTLQQQQLNEARDAFNTEERNAS
jgi:hypothetical protein